MSIEDREEHRDVGAQVGVGTKRESMRDGQHVTQCRRQIRRWTRGGRGHALTSEPIGARRRARSQPEQPEEGAATATLCRFQPQTFLRQLHQGFVLPREQALSHGYPTEEQRRGSLSDRGAVDHLLTPPGPPTPHRPPIVPTTEFVTYPWIGFGAPAHGTKACMCSSARINRAFDGTLATNVA